LIWLLISFGFKSKRIFYNLQLDLKVKEKGAITYAFLKIIFGSPLLIYPSIFVANS